MGGVGNANLTGDLSDSGLGDRRGTGNARVGWQKAWGGEVGRDGATIRGKGRNTQTHWMVKKIRRKRRRLEEEEEEEEEEGQQDQECVFPISFHLLPHSVPPAMILKGATHATGSRDPTQPGVSGVNLPEPGLSASSL